MARSALEVNALNTNVKDLLVEFTEKKDKEDEIATKEKKLEGMQPTIETTDANGQKTSKTNEEYTLITTELGKSSGTDNDNKAIYPEIYLPRYN